MAAVRQIVGDGLDSVLHRLESGVDLALMRASAWSKYTKELVSYVERRSNMCKCRSLTYLTLLHTDYQGYTFHSHDGVT